MINHHGYGKNVIDENLKSHIYLKIIIKHYIQVMQFQKIVRFKQDLEWTIRSPAALKKVEGSTTR